MIKITFSHEDLEALRYWRFQHPDPRIQLRMEALYLRRQGVAKGEILQLCGMSKASFHRALNAYLHGGIDALKRIDHDRPRSVLHNHGTTLETYFRQHPPATVAAAAATSAELTGMVRKPTQVRQFLKTLGRQPRKVGLLPAKADVEAPEAVKKKPGAKARRSRVWHTGGLLR
jgi:transposase